MKKLVAMVLLAASFGTHAGGSIIIGGRAAPLKCFQVDRSLPDYRFELVGSVAKLVITSGRDAVSIPMSCAQDSAGSVLCQAAEEYSVVLNGTDTAGLFGSQGLIKNLACESK